MAEDHSWEEVAERVRNRLDQSIPPEWRLQSKPDQLNVTSIPFVSGILTEREIVITNTSAYDLVFNISHGVWTAEDVARAFCKRAAIAHQVTRCLTVTMFDEAIEHARELDKYYRDTGSTVGPLHGLPISIKDNFNVIGKTSATGFVAWAEEPMQEESTIVGLIRELGAVIYVKSNVPTAMMIAETVNNCYGRTVNPLNTELTCGGSSGGESALIAMNGSPLGIGTDIGGSLRIPAACTGLFTLKPSFGRFPHFDARSGMAGQEAIVSIHGPLARNVADLRLYAQTICNAGPWLRDPKCIAIPWREGDLKQKLKIGVLWDDGIVIPTPPVRRALKQVAEQLRSKGYEIVDWSNEGHAEMLQIVAKLFSADGGTSIRKIIEQSGEPWRPELGNFENASDMGVYELWQVQKQRTALAKKYLDRWQASEGMDAILAPTTPYAAPKHGDFKYVGYTAVYNLLDYSAVSFPTGLHADKVLDAPSTEDRQPLSDFDKATSEAYNAEAVHGIPISLQIVGKRLQEEKILDVAERVCLDLRWD